MRMLKEAINTRFNSSAVIAAEHNFYDFPTFMEDMIDEMPTADVEPVRHGKWINKGYAMCACSICDGVYLGRDDNTGWSDTLYCGYCGAKMDGGSK